MPDPIQFDTTTVRHCDGAQTVFQSEQPSSGSGALGDIAASPVAAWNNVSLSQAQMEEMVDLVNFDVEGPPQANADYWVLVMEAPYVQAAGSTSRTEDTSNDKLKLIPLSEFLTTYTGEARSYMFGVRGGAGIDESLTIAAIFEWALQNGGSSVVRIYIRSRKASDPIYINRLATLYASNVHVKWLSPVVLGAAGGLRIMGDQPEVLRNGKTFKASLRAQAAAGSTTLQLSTSTPTTKMQASDFQVGDVIVLRGQNDVYGKALTKQVVHVASVDAGLNNVTLNEELEYTFETTYPLSDWVPDLTTGTTVALAAYAALTVNAAAGLYTVRVNRTQLESSGIAIGSMVLVSTNETEFDLNPNAHTSAGVPYKNAVRLEWKIVRAIVVVDAGNSDVTFDTTLLDAYTTAKFGGITLISPVVNSEMRGVRASYNADQVSRNTHGVQLGYSYKSRLVDCEIDGSGGQKGNGVRLSNSLECAAIRCRVSNPKFSGSGEGYGHACYYAERCQFIDCFGEGCRHTYLAQKANGTLYAYCESVNDSISGFDTHGVRSINTHFFACRGFGGPGLSADATHKSIFRVGNTSHAVGDIGTIVTGCFAHGAALAGLIDTYAALEVFGRSSDVVFQDNYIADCQCGIRAGYDNDSVTEPDPITNLVQRNNVWVRVTDIEDYKSTSTVDDQSDGIREVAGVSTANLALTPSMPIDSSAPLVTEGVQVLTTTYTSRAPRRRIRLAFVCPFIQIPSGTTGAVAGAIFVDGVFLKGTVVRVTLGATSGEGLTINTTFLATGAAQAITVRMGEAGAVGAIINPSANNWGGAAAPYMVINESN